MLEKDEAIGLLSVDPTTIIGEILGDPAHSMRNPANADYQCPFLDAVCTKRGHLTTGPYPVCSIHRSQLDQRLMSVCPNRFYEAEISRDVIQNCWIGKPPENPRVAYEVQMASFGQVDLVIADLDIRKNKVRQFISVELQAVDLSGSVESAYTAVVNNRMLDRRPSYGINWANVRKRYISQLITKGFYHHQWGTRIVSVLQTQLYERLKNELRFDELPLNDNANVVFMAYTFVPAPEKGIPGAQKIVLDKVVGTSHSSLMTGVLYHQTPSKEAFCDKILAQF